MIVNQNLVKRVKDYFDLNIYETKVWLALLSKGVLTAGETAELSGVPRSRTYDVLESLAKRGFAIVKIGKPVKYIAANPSTVIEKMKTEVLSTANDKVKVLSNLKGTNEFTELEQLHNTGISPIRSEDISGFMRGRTNILPKLKELLMNAEKEVVIYTSVEDFEDKIRILSASLEEINKKDLKIKIALSGDSERIKRLNNKYNLKAKTIDNPGKFYLVDRKEAIFMITPHNAEEEVAVWLNAPFFSESILGLTDYHFKK